MSNLLNVLYILNVSSLFFFTFVVIGTMCYKIIPPYADYILLIPYTFSGISIISELIFIEYLKLKIVLNLLGTILFLVPSIYLLGLILNKAY